MVYERSLITPPALEPLSKEEAKKHCLVDHDEDDGYLTALISVASEKLRMECSRAFITESWEIYPPCFPRADWISLPLGNLQNVTSFNWTDTAGTMSSWSVSGSNLVESGITRAHIDTKSLRGRIVLAYNQYWPVTVLKTANPITIGFDCGYGDASAVPALLKHAMLLLIEQWYKNRDVAVVGKSVTMIELPQAVDSLISNYRLY